MIAVYYGPVRIEVTVHTQEEPYSCTKRIRAGQPRLVVHDDVPFEIPAWCDRPEIVQHGGKKLFVVHCPATGEEKDKWRVIRRLGGGRWPPRAGVPARSARGRGPGPRAVERPAQT